MANGACQLKNLYCMVVKRFIVDRNPEITHVTYIVPTIEFLTSHGDTDARSSFVSLCLHGSNLS